MAAVLLAAPGAASAAKGGSCNIASPTGERTIALTNQGVSRPFALHVPSGYKRRKPVPLIIALHSSGSNGPDLLSIGGFPAAADRQGYAVAAPNGAVEMSGGFYWNQPGVPLIGGTPVPAGTPSDEAYLRGVIKAAKRSVCVDPRRIYLTGFSGGARMASQMACDNSRSIAAVAPVAGLRAGVPRELSDGVWEPDPATCDPASPVSVVAFHGTADGTNPYPGNDDPRWGYSVDQALAGWAGNDGCKRGPSTTAKTPTVDLVSYSRCKDGSAVSLYRATGAGHTWPGSTGPEAGPIDGSISATALMMKFFKSHPLPERKR